MSVDDQILMTKTQHYRKITKPILERKRRARINSYLDELKFLIIDALEEHGEHVNKLEKADILEMTVNYLKMITHQTNHALRKTEVNTVEICGSISFEQFREGFSQATYDVSKVLHNMSDHNNDFGVLLLQHLRYQLKEMKDKRYKQKPIIIDKYSRWRMPQLNGIKINQSNMKYLQTESNIIWRPW